MTDAERAVLECLIAYAMRNSRQSRCVADFLLARWNPDQYGGFDITAAWGLDDGVVEDVVVVSGYAAWDSHYPNTLGYGSWFEAIVREW